MATSFPLRTPQRPPCTMGSSGRKTCVPLTRTESTWPRVSDPVTSFWPRCCLTVTHTAMPWQPQRTNWALCLHWENMSTDNQRSVLGQFLVGASWSDEVKRDYISDFFQSTQTASPSFLVGSFYQNEPDYYSGKFFSFFRLTTECMRSGHFLQNY